MSQSDWKNDLTDFFDDVQIIEKCQEQALKDFDQLCEFFEDFGNTLVLGDLELMEFDSLVLHRHLLQLLSNVFLSGSSQFTPFDKMALIVVPVFAADEDDPIIASRNGFRDPHDIERTQAPNRDDSHKGTALNAVLSYQIHGRKSIVLTEKCRDSWFLFPFLRNIDGFHHGGDDFDRIVFKGDNSFRTGPHTDSTATTPRGAQQRRPLLILIQNSKRTFLRAAFALGTSLQKEIGI